MSERVKLCDLEVRGQTFGVEVDQSGFFHAIGPDGAFWSDTLAEMREKLMKSTKRAAVKVHIPFFMLDGSRAIRHGVVTGEHRKTGTILVKWDDGRTETMTKYGVTLYRPLTPEEVEVWGRLVAALAGANREVCKFLFDRKLDYASIITAAEQAAEQAP